VTNGVSAIATARFNGSPLVVLGGRAPDYRRGAEACRNSIIHRCSPHHQTSLDRALDGRHRRGGGQRVPAGKHVTSRAVFLDIPMGALFGEATAELPARDATTPGEPPSGPDPGAIARIAELKRAGEGLDLEGDR